MSSVVHTKGDHVVTARKAKPLIGMVGMGWVGAHVAWAIQERGYTVIAFDTDARKPYACNRSDIVLCDIVFIAVPTPTRREDSGGCDVSSVREALQHVGNGKIAVIKSTIPPRTLEALQRDSPEVFLFHAPEFLTEANAAYDAARPTRNVIGIPEGASAEHRAKVDDVLVVLPIAPVIVVCSATESALIKYLSNFFLTVQVLRANMAYDIVEVFGAKWDTVRQGIVADPRIGSAHSDPLHGDGRGVGGDCLIKDLSALRQFTAAPLGKNFDVHALLSAFEEYNIALLRASGKDLDKLAAVYGPRILETA